MRITDLVLGFVSMVAGILTLIANKEFWPAGLSLIVTGFLIMYFTDYTSRIVKNEFEIKKLKEKLIIYERLSKLEAQIFK